MFKQVLAIDVAAKIPDFLCKIRPFSERPPIVVEEITSLNMLDTLLVDAILVSIYQLLSVDFLSQFPSLKYIGVLGTSTKKIPLGYCHEKQIIVLPVTDYCDDETAEWVMWQIIKFFRKKNPQQSVFNKKLGIVGVGPVGTKLAHLGHAFHMSVFYNAQKTHKQIEDMGIKPLHKEEMFSLCDVVSFHTPPMVSWLSTHILQHAKKGLCIINTCMGRISHAQDLENFLMDRADITMIMDKIAGDNYKNLRGRAHIIDEPAFFTCDSQKKLIDKFFSHLEKVLTV
jgi:glycerate dehydrogenase